MPSARLGRRLRVLTPWRHRRRDPVTAGVDGAGGNEQADQLQAAGQTLRRRREEMGLSLRDLAECTRISTPVLEALERGWRDRLPEAAYLRTMLSLIEQELTLPEGSLAGALPQQGLGARPSSRRDRLLRFTPGSIDVYTTWQGSVLYGLLTLGLIYGLNLQLRHQADGLALTAMPLVPLPVDGSGEGGQGALLPERLMPLRPLAALEQGGLGPTGRFRLATQPQRMLEGELTFELGSPGRVGVVLKSTPMGPAPPELHVMPPPEAELQVLWNGERLLPIEGESGRYRLSSERRPVPAPQDP